jgi:hypothetical protein
MSVPLDGGVAQALGSLPGAVEVRDACFTDRWIVAATDQGIYMFPRGGGAGAPTKITAAADESGA